MEVVWQSALSERDIHFVLRFLVRVFNSVLMNSVASGAVNGPWTRPFFISSRPLAIARSIMRLCSEVYSSSTLFDFVKIVITPRDALNSSRSQL